MNSTAKRQRTGRRSYHPASSRPGTASAVRDGPSHRSTAPTQQITTLRQAQSSRQPADEDFDQIIAAIDMREAGTVGCSYYAAHEEKLYLLEDIKHSNTEILDTLIIQIKPTILLVSSRSISLYLQSLTRQLGARPYLPYQLDIRPPQEFNHSNAKNKLVALEISSRHEDRFKFLVPHGGLVDTDQLDNENLDFTLQEGRHLHMASFLDLENKVTLGCAGAILTYLQRRRSSDLIAGDTASASELYQIRSFEMSALSGTMFVNARTLAALQILESESHPSMANQGPGKKSSSAKEGLSIYGLFQRFTCTPQGKQRLRQIFLRPSIRLDVIHERHALISVYLQADNYNPMNKMKKSLRHIKDLRPVMINLQKGISTGSGKVSGFKTTVWSTLLAFAFYGIDVHNALMETSNAHDLGLHNKAINAESSDEQGRTVVKAGVDRELDRMKDSYDGLDSLLKRVAIEIAAGIPASFDIDVNVIYFPQLGFNIAIPLAVNGQAAHKGEEWELMFTTENRAYFKDFRMKEMDEKLGDIYGLICEKEIEIVYELAQRVLRYDKVLIEASEVCGEIDSLLAMAQGVTCYNLIRPKMVEDNIIKIKGGRHMLQELTVSSYVPNDSFLVGGSQEQSTSYSDRAPDALRTGSSPSMLLLTGPNYSGKSVYMKQVALIVYLAQCGSFVPAESAEIGIVDKILVKSNSQDSVSQIQSTFMNDLQQISFDLKHLTDRSLLLIDEFGKGTCENDGIGLACGILEHLVTLESAPKVIAATHFHEILEHGFLPPTPRLQLGHMEVRMSESEEVDNQVTYLYKYELGATLCAALNGISKTIVDRANEFVSLTARGEDLIAACAELSEEEIQVLQEADTLARKFVAMDFSPGCEGDVRKMLEELLGS
ncbi:muts domain V-domain-containing protein [Aspergillus heterothallicus]